MASKFRNRDSNRHAFKQEIDRRLVGLRPRQIRPYFCRSIFLAGLGVADCLRLHWVRKLSEASTPRCRKSNHLRLDRKGLIEFS